MIDEREILRLTSIVRTELDMSEEQSEEEVRRLIARIVYRETEDENL